MQAAAAKAMTEEAVAAVARGGARGVPAGTQVRVVCLSVLYST